MDRPWETSPTNVGEFHRLYLSAGVKDDRGRPVGCFAFVQEYKNHPHGHPDAFDARVHPARCGEPFGAIRRSKVFKSLDEAKAHAERQARVAVERAAKRWGGR